MEKKDIIERYKKVEDRLLVSKFFDRIALCEKTNKVETTDFLNEMEQNILKKVIDLAKVENCIFCGGYENADRKIAILFPKKMEGIVENGSFKYDTLFTVFNISIPDNNNEIYTHSIYLGGIIKLGVKREKIGDIIVRPDGANIIVKKELEKFI